MKTVLSFSAVPKSYDLGILILVDTGLSTLKPFTYALPASTTTETWSSSSALPSENNSKPLTLYEPDSS